MEIRGESQNKYWSNRAHTYGHQYGLDTETAKIKVKRKVNEMAKYLDFNVGKIIECGCGTGLFTKEFLRLNPKLLSTDLSSDMIGVARKYCPEGNFMQLDARKMNLSDESYDVVVSSFLLQHVETELVLPEMYRILKPNGCLGAFVPNILNPLHYSRARVGFMRSILHENSQSEDFNRWQWEKILSRQGFNSIVVRPIEFTSPYLPLGILPLATKISEILERLPLIKEFAGSLLIVARKV
ncbi:MAG: class I SAM-dependent methyltransferase [Dehalococcoidales bacterium]|nr:class I SAM-dependent methyltransferase [Dehalococcoidales bacterium]